MTKSKEQSTKKKAERLTKQELAILARKNALLAKDIALLDEPYLQAGAKLNACKLRNKLTIKKRIQARELVKLEFGANCEDSDAYFLALVSLLCDFGVIDAKDSYKKVDTLSFLELLEGLEMSSFNNAIELITKK